MGGKRVVDYSGMLKTLKDNPNYKSEAAKKAIEITEKMNKIHGLDHTLADAFKAPKDPKLQQGFSHNVAVRYLTMAANRAVQNVFADGKDRGVKTRYIQCRDEFAKRARTGRKAIKGRDE